jgi:gas vesicle protein
MTDRFDNHEGGGSFVMGLLTGTVLGAGLGMLFAPKPFSELRNQLSEGAGALANQAQEGYRTVTENAGQWAEKGKEAAGEWAEGGKDLYGKALEAVERGADEAQKQVSDAAGSVTGAIPAPASGTGSNASSSSTSYGSRPTTYPKGTESTRGSGSSSSDSPSGPSGRTRAEGGSRAS